MSVRAPPGTDVAYHVEAQAHRYLASAVPPEHIKDREYRADLPQLPIHIPDVRFPPPPLPLVRRLSPTSSVSGLRAAPAHPGEVP